MAEARGEEAGDGDSVPVQRVVEANEDQVWTFIRDIRQEVEQEQHVAVMHEERGEVGGAVQQDEAAVAQINGAELGDIPVALPDTQDQPLPPVDSLPSIETVHTTFIPTQQWVAKAIECNRVAYNPDNIAGWTLYSMFAKAILPAAPLRPDTSQAKAVRDRLARWRQGEYEALWREAVELTKKKKKRRRNQQQGE